MIDIHCHLLPSVDDGAVDMDETIKMAKIAVSEGIHTIIVTPHYIEYGDYLNKEELKPVLNDVNQRLKDEQIELTLALGQEVYSTPNLISLLQRDEITTLNDSRYLLLEFPMNEIPTYAEDLIYELKILGITPIIAHPERYPMIMDNPNRLIEFIELGALCQSNVGSINGAFGERVKETVWTLIKHQMIHFVATDAHTSRRRGPVMKDAFQAVRAYDTELAQKLFFDHPSKVYLDAEIKITEPLTVEKKSFFDRLFKRKKS